MTTAEAIPIPSYLIHRAGELPAISSKLSNNEVTESSQVGWVLMKRCFCGAQLWFQFMKGLRAQSAQPTFMNQSYAISVTQPPPWLSLRKTKSAKAKVGAPPMNRCCKTECVRTYPTASVVKLSLVEVISACYTMGEDDLFIECCKNQSLSTQVFW